jgi:queuine/archaeosine tRNA-ribosyltransferase
MRKSPREYAKELIENKKKKNEPQFALGFFTGTNSKNLAKLRIKEKFEKRLNYINNVRIALYHFNTKKIKALQKKGKTQLEKITNPITSELQISITAYRTYNIMKELIENLYNDKTRIKFIKEGLEDYEKKRKSSAEKVYNSQFKGLPKVPKSLIKDYEEKRAQHNVNEAKELLRKQIKREEK